MRSWRELFLNEIAMRMGSFLRNFNDPDIHLGLPERFAQQFIALLNQPALHSMNALVSYAEAVQTSADSTGKHIAEEPATPASVLLQGLQAAQAKVDPETIHGDVAALLRFPALKYYLQVSDRTRFFAALDEIARFNDFHLVKTSNNAGPACSGCGNAVNPGGFTIKCSMCGIALETVAPLPMVPAASACVSYEMLRRIVALDMVETYQEESEIKPVFTNGALNDVN